MALSHEVLRAMLIHKPRLTILTWLALGAVATGAGFLTQSLAMTDEPKGPPAPRPAEANPAPIPGRMFVTGRVLDPQGKPVPGAAIMVHARNLALTLPGRWRLRLHPIGEARADGAGRFRIEAPRTSSSRYANFGAVALAPGHGAGWVELDPDVDQPDAEITLRPEQIIHGQLVDGQGRPAPNVTLAVWSIHRVLARDPATGRPRLDGITYPWTHPNDFPAWPRPVTTDAEGRYTLRGVGRDLRVLLTAHHPRFALQRMVVETKGAAESKPMTAALAPAQIITGRVTYADTGQPVPRASLRVMASQGRVGLLAEFETDAEGRFRVNPPPTDRSYGVIGFPPQGQPYLTAAQQLEWPAGALEQSLDLALPRGVLIHGTVTEEGSGRPVAGAAVEFVTQAERQTREGGAVALNTASDGSFQLGAVPSPGHLFIKGPGDDYVLQDFGARLVEPDRPGGGRIYAHAHIALDLKPGRDTKEVHLTLRRGTTAAGQVVGPDGQPVRDAWIISRIILDPRLGTWRRWNGRIHGAVRHGRFEVRGLDPEVETPVSFLDPKRHLGATVKLSGRSAARGPITVRLEPCGAARARLVDSRGKPRAEYHGPDPLMMVVTPGPPRSRAPEKAAGLFADETALEQVDPVNHGKGLVADAKGRLMLPVLIPGATYRFIDYTTAHDPAGPQVRKEFTVQPGETLDLGDILVEKP